MQPIPNSQSTFVFPLAESVENSRTESTTEPPAKPDALISMNSDEFREKLNSGTLPDGPILVTGDLGLTEEDALANLPARLTVRGDLRLFLCRSLMSLPEGLTVDGRLNIRGCTSLTSLSAGLIVRRSLYLVGCTSLTSLPAGLTMDVNLDLEGCTSLTSLPEGLTEGGVWSLRGCTSLTSLAAGLTVREGLSLVGCTSLTSLPEGLTVGGSLDLSGCTSLTSLPERLTVGRSLDFQGCTSLTSLPNWITELGPRRDGQVRDVNLIGTGLSDALIDRLRNLQPPPHGMRFIFSRQAAPVEDAFTSIDEAISFWKALIEDAPSVSLNLETSEARNLINFLTRLNVTAEYQNILARPVLAKRICNVLKKMEDQEFRERASLIIHEGLSSCHDRIVSALDELDVMLQVNEAEEGGKREELYALGKSMLMLEEVKKAARLHASTLTWVDEIEIQLAFQIRLRDRLQLPLSTGNMHHRGCAHVSDEEIQQVGAEIERRVSEEMVDKYLQTWAPWQKLLRREAFDALEPELQEAPSDLNWECCLSFDELTEGYLYGGNLYARDSLRTVYVDKGVDPFTNQPIDLAQVIKVVKSSIALKE